jgi:dipeptidyl aminopeptidase/acylaminoacyl peptidase
VHGSEIYWLESRPAEDGRTVLVKADAGGGIRDLLPAPFSARSRVHEYGGGAYSVWDGRAFFVNDADQCLYSLDDSKPRRITAPGTRRYADPLLDVARARLLCVCEDHTAEPPQNFLAAVDLAEGALTPVVQGRDFYSSPALSPDGCWLAWLSWDHPQMPWDGCELWLAALDAAGTPREPRCIAGGPQESLFQPRFAPDGRLYCISDRSGWWNIYRCADGDLHAVAPDAADYAFPQWGFGMSAYAFESAQHILALRIADGLSSVVRIDAERGTRSLVTDRYSQIDALDAAEGVMALVGSAPDAPAAVVRSRGDALQVLQRSGEMMLDAAFISVAEPLSFATTEGETAHGWYYPPRHRDCRVPDGELPPLIVKCHGGPTAMNGDGLELKLQFWTSRGFAVVDVNYRGSSGYGRVYRESLKGQWGVRDVADCIHAARHLVARGLADPKRLIISGSSAGGFTVLSALAFHDVFQAGAVYYGLSELETAMTGTHKFEAHYGDSLLGPWPAARDIYQARSPLYAADRIRAAVIFFQGLKDTVVLPEQTERMRAALKDNGVPVACLTFPEEGHGFRRAATVTAALSAELAFYSRIFGLQPADALPALPIDNLR